VKECGRVDFSSSNRASSLRVQPPVLPKGFLGYAERIEADDATGAGRQQVLDRNWKVCGQSVAAGETITAR
jgi:hypothetical protein